MKWLLLLALLISKGAAADETQSPAILIKGEHGIIWQLLTDNALEPVLTADGFPIYESVWKEKSVVMSLKQLQKLHLLKKPQTPKSTSDWVSGAVELKVGPSFIKEGLDALSSDPSLFAKVFSNLTPGRIKFLQSLFFSPEVTIAEEDFKDLLRSSADPDPAPMMIPLNYQAWFSFVWKMSLDVQIEQLDLKIRSRSINFIPGKSMMRLTLDLERATIKGPTKKLGYPFGIENEWRYGGYRKLAYLEKGEIENVNMTVDFALEKFDDLFFQLKMKDFQFNLSPDYRKAKLVIADNPDSDNRETRDLNVSNDVEMTIEKTLKASIERALGKLLYAEGFAPLLEWNHKKAKGVLSQKLSDFQIVSDGILLRFDSKWDFESISDCGNIDFPFVQRVYRNSEAVSQTPIQENKESDFAYKLDSDGKWISQSEVNASTLEISFKKSMSDLLSWGLWKSGLFCYSTQDLWPRSSTTPWLQVVTRQPPSLEWSDRGDLLLNGQVDLLNYDRDGVEEGESFVLSAQHRLNLQLELNRSNNGVEFKLQPLKLHLLDGTHEENEMVHRLLSKSMEVGLSHFEIDDEGVSLQNALQLISPSWKISNLDFANDKVKVGLQLQEPLQSIWKNKPQPLPEMVEPELPVVLKSLVTSIVSDQPSQIDHRYPKIQFDNSHPDVFYTWRLNQGPWSPLTSEKETTLFLPEEGLYLFEVKAVDPLFNIEKTSAKWSFEFEENKELKESVLTNKKEITEEWNQPSQFSQKIKEKKSVSISRRSSAESPGLFGCAMGSKGEPISTAGLVVGFLFGGILLLLRLILGRKSASSQV